MPHLPLDADRTATLEAALEAYLDTLVDVARDLAADGEEQEAHEARAEIERASDLLADLGRIRAHAE